MATLLLQECPLIVMVTFGRLPPPSASTTFSGTSNPLMGSGGSTSVRNFMICSCPEGAAPPGRRLLGVGLVLPLGAVADVPDVAVRVGEGSAGPAPVQGGGGLEDRAAGLLRFRQDLVNPLLAADDVGEDHPAEATAFRARPVVGGQTIPAVEADERAAVGLEEHGDAVVPLDLPAETRHVELLRPVHVPDAEEDRAHVRGHAVLLSCRARSTCACHLACDREAPLLDS